MLISRRGLVVAEQGPARLLTPGFSPSLENPMGVEG